MLNSLDFFANLFLVMSGREENHFQCGFSICLPLWFSISILTQERQDVEINFWCINVYIDKSWYVLRCLASEVLDKERKKNRFFFTKKLLSGCNWVWSTHICLINCISVPSFSFLSQAIRLKIIYNVYIFLTTFELFPPS